MKQITEEMGIHKKWYEEAKKIKTPAELKAFTEKIINDYGHDYGTICHACAAVAIAGAECVNHDPKQGGITGFQAGAIMWEFIKNWNAGFSYDKNPLQLLNFGDLLYPQKEERFTTISESTWKWAQKEAQELLNERSENVHPDVLKHWKSVASGTIPFGLKVRET